MDNIEVPQWLMWVLSIGSSLGGSALLSAIVPAKYFKYIKFIGPIAETILKLLGGNWGNATSATPEQIEEQKEEAQLKKAAKPVRKHHKSIGR